MADSVATTVAKKIPAWLKTILWITGVLLIIWLIYWFFYLKGIDMTKVKQLIAKEAAGYSNPTDMERILLEGVSTITDSPKALQQARDYAKTSGVPIEQVLVDNALAMAKSYGYIDK